ncbi:hypothetical protein TrVE_jg10144 [Triparma verrucosa]|uniref:Uncharacterized protein n=1 Tax=Triparma verrucosa TaxID=1606542 RepID=A0A9W7BTW3_9STRA|nr:hypothetical protein TrVE_jg10144 [Triparma verrucosa]
MATVKISPEERYLLSYEAIAAELQLAKDEITKLRSSNRYLSSQLLEMAVMKVENARLIEEKELLLQNSDIPSPLTPQSQAQSSSDLVAIPSKQTSLSAPKDAEVIILFFCELMRSRKLASVLPECDKLSTQLTRSDLIQVARGFDSLSNTSKITDDVIKAVFDRYPAMKELTKRNPFLEEALIITSVRLANSGNKTSDGFRLTLGVLLSFFDTTSDINMIFVYYADGRKGFARAILASILLNIALQLFLVYQQNKNQPKSNIFREILAVFTLTKPGINAYRVSRGAEAEVGSFTDLHTEMIMGKCSELLAEAIPGTCIQVLALLSGSTTSSSAIFGLVTSVVTASFISTLIAYEMDTDISNRKHTPNFYGYMPDKALQRMKAALAMLVMSSCQLLAKAFCCSLLGIISVKYVIVYLFTDMAVYLLYKLLRHDFAYGLKESGQHSESLLSVFWFSLLLRVCSKIITDFTGNVHMRHPYELGGVYWCWTLLSMPFFCYFFGLKYLAFVQSDEGKARGYDMVLEPQHLCTMIGSLFLLQGLMFLCVLKSFKPEYIKTFYDTKSGNQQAIDLFQKNEEDELKIQIFTKSVHKWSAIKEEVVDWTLWNIPEWNESQPDWWDARVKSTIPGWAVSDPGLLESIRSDEVEAIRQRPTTWGGMGGESTDDVQSSSDGDMNTIRRRGIAREARRDLTQTGRYL